MELVFLMTACISIVAVALICIFLFANGLPAIRQIGAIQFLTGTLWRPGTDDYAVLPMIIGSLYKETHGYLSGLR